MFSAEIPDIEYLVVDDDEYEYRDVDDDGKWCDAQWDYNTGRVWTQS